MFWLRNKKKSLRTLNKRPELLSSMYTCSIMSSVLNDVSSTVIICFASSNGSGEIARMHGEARAVSPEPLTDRLCDKCLFLM